MNRAVRGAAVAAIIIGGACNGRGVAAQSFPPIPEMLLGVNQYNVGLPKDEGKFWPLTDAEVEYLKGAIGLNVVRFPLYPWELGLDGEALCRWKPGDVFSERQANRLPVDWRSLDAILDRLAKSGVTPYICPVAEGATWPSKLWMNLHVPECFARTAWFTKLVVRHVHDRYGDNVIYGWYEDWFWNTGLSLENADSRLLEDWRRTLSGVYRGRIGALNREWGTDYRSFAEAPMPSLFRDGDVPPEAHDSRRTYDLRMAVDLIHRRNLREVRDSVKEIAPEALFAGGCLCGELGGLQDTRSVRPVRLNGTIRTHAAVCDVVAADCYGPPPLLSADYRTIAKIAASEGRKLLIAEVPGTKPEAFSTVAEVGGPTIGACVWAGKEDGFGLIKFDGTRRDECIRAAAGLWQAYRSDPSRYSRYHKGRIHVYVPEETWNYAVTRINHVEAYRHLFDDIRPEDIEPVLTAELAHLPRDIPLFVLEKTMPSSAIRELGRRHRQVVSPHRFFVDENGRRVPRTALPDDFWRQLHAVRDGDLLADAFQRVVEKEQNIAYGWLGATVTSDSALAPKNDVTLDRPNVLTNLNDGSVFDGVTFADAPQQEVVDVLLPVSRRVSGVFTQLYPGDGQGVGPSRVPELVRVLVSSDGEAFREVAQIEPRGKLRIRAGFEPCDARWVRLDFGWDTAGVGLRAVEVGVVGQVPEPALPGSAAASLR